MILDVLRHSTIEKKNIFTIFLCSSPTALDSPDHLVHRVDDEEHRPRGAEEEGDDGHEAHLAVGRREGEGEDHEGDAAVLDGGLQADGNDLGPAWNGKGDGGSNLRALRIQGNDGVAVKAT